MYETRERTVCCDSYISGYDSMQDHCCMCGKRRPNYGIMSYPEVGQWVCRKWWHHLIGVSTWVPKEDDE